MPHVNKNKITGCMECGWIYKDTPGMGIHRAPFECPRCKGHIKTYPESVWESYHWETLNQV